MGTRDSHEAWADPEVLTSLKTHWAAGISCSKIAAELNATHNTAFSRNAIIGKVCRLGLPPRSGETNRLNGKIAGREERARRVKPRKQLSGRPQPANHPFRTGGVAQPPVDPATLRQALVADPRPAVLRDLPPHSCKWPLPGQDDIPLGWAETLLFCGAVVEDDGVSEPPPYCCAHMALAYRPGKPRNLLRLAQPSRGCKQTTVFDRAVNA